MKKRYLIIAAAIATLIGLVELGVTRNQAISQAQSIIAKDKVGDDTKADLTKLTDYIHNHTRTSVTFTLEGSYQRAAQAAQQAAIPQANSNVYAAAQAACNSKNPVAMATCIQTYVQTHAPAGAQPHPVALPDVNAYTYHLNSPAWAPDVVGISFLVALIGLVTAAWLAIVARISRPSY